MAFRRALCWIRRDLRLSDHAALAEATRSADEVVVVFVWDETILKKLDDCRNRRVTFIHRSLKEVHEGLQEARSGLVVRRGDPVDEIPKLAKEIEADLVVWGRDYDPNAMRQSKR